MCAILDRSKFGEFIKPTDEGRLFRDWLEEEDGCIVYPVDDETGKIPPALTGYMRRLIEEFSNSRKLRRVLLDYRERGKVRRVFLSEVARHYPTGAKIRSDDSHILALALASGARLLYTGDKKLAKDFANSDIIGNPAGEVYMSAVDQERLRPDICKNC